MALNRQRAGDSLLWDRRRRRDRLGTALGVRQEQLAARAARPHRDLARDDRLNVAQRLGQVLRGDEDAVAIARRQHRRLVNRIDPIQDLVGIQKFRLVVGVPPGQRVELGHQ